MEDVVGTMTTVRIIFYFYIYFLKKTITAPIRPQIFSPVNDVMNTNKRNFLDRNIKPCVQFTNLKVKIVFKFD